jgi:hypothetical protein
VRYTKQTHAQYAAEKKTKSLKRERKAEQALGDMRPIAGVDGERALRDLADVQRNGGKRQRMKTARRRPRGYRRGLRLSASRLRSLRGTERIFDGDLPSGASCAGWIHEHQVLFCFSLSTFRMESGDICEQ